MRKRTGKVFSISEFQSRIDYSINLNHGNFHWP